MCNEKLDTVEILKIDSLTRLLNVIKIHDPSIEKSRFQLQIEKKLAELIEQL